MRTFTVILLFGVTVMLLGCGLLNGGENSPDREPVTPSNSEAITIVDVEDLTIAECEEFYGAGAVMNVQHAFPATATVEQIKGAIGKLLLLQSVPPGLEIAARSVSIENQVAYVQYEAPLVEGQRTEVLSIEQGPTNGRTWQLEAKDGYYEMETVNGAPAYIIRGGFLVRSRMVDGVEIIDSCGWEPEWENSLVFVSNGHAVRIAGRPASAFPPSSLTTLARSLVEYPGSQGADTS